jgi:hypothetical protein
MLLAKIGRPFGAWPRTPAFDDDVLLRYEREQPGMDHFRLSPAHGVAINAPTGAIRSGCERQGGRRPARLLPVHEKNGVASE